MSRITTRTLSAVLAFMVPTLAVAQTTVEDYTDPVVYQVEAKFPVVTYPTGYVLDSNYPWESTTPFDASLGYTPEEQEAVIAEELRLTGGRLITGTDGSAEIVIQQPTIPEATRDTAPPAEDIYEENGQAPAPQLKGQSIGPTAIPDVFSRRYLHKNGFGNNLFGASYSIDTFVKATEASGTSAKKVQAYVEGKVNGTAFNTTRELFRTRVDVAGQQGGTNSGTLRMYAMGQQIRSQNLAASFSFTPIQYNRSFFNVSKRFMVGPVPVKVQASLGGGVKLTLSGKISPTEAKLTATPGGYVNVGASAGIDIFIVAFGVSGSLNLINVGLPATAELIWPVCSGLTWKLGANLSLNTLSGNIKLWAKVWFVFFSKTWHVTIANWNGLTYNIPLASKSGSFAWGICPGFAPAAATPLMSVAELQ